MPRCGVSLYKQSDPIGNGPVTIKEDRVSNVLNPLKVGALLVSAMLVVSACGDTWGQRAVTGGAIGVGTGAAIGAATGGLSVVGGALIGGAIGAGVGAATTPK
jgi:hypothetical protein